MKFLNLNMRFMALEYTIVVALDAVVVVVVYVVVV